MSEVEVIPELKQIIGAMLFAAKAPLGVPEIRRVLQQTGEAHDGAMKEFAKLKEADIRRALEAYRAELDQHKVGFHLGEVAGGFRLQNDLACGPWLRILLDKGRSNRLSKPALETLAIIAYRQPATRSEIEAVRGVAVDAILRNLMEMQLIRAVGRSDLPGRPWQFGTTHKFLEYFGLKDVKDLPGIEELKRIEAEQEQRRQEEAAAAAAAVAAAGPAPAAGAEAISQGQSAEEEPKKEETAMGREVFGKDEEEEEKDLVDEDEKKDEKDDEEEEEYDDEDDDEDEEEEEEESDEDEEDDR